MPDIMEGAELQPESDKNHLFWNKLSKGESNHSSFSNSKNSKQSINSFLEEFHSDIQNSQLSKEDEDELFEQLLKLDYDSNNPFPIDEFLEFIYINSQNDSKIELFIIKRTKNTFTYNNNKQRVKYNICLFSFLELVFKRFPEIDNDKIINPEKLLKKGSLPCKHFIRCINLNRNLLTNDIIEYFNDPLSNERIFSLNSPKGKEHNTFVENSLRLYPIIPQLFNQYTNLLKKNKALSTIESLKDLWG